MNETIVVKVINSSFSKLIQEHVFAHGWTWYSGTTAVQYTKDSTLGFCRKNKNIISTSLKETGISLNEAYKVLGEWFKDDEALEVKLNNEHTAVINFEDSEVKVGCTTFDFKCVDELYAAIHHSKYVAKEKKGCGFFVEYNTRHNTLKVYSAGKGHSYPIVYEFFTSPKSIRSTGKSFARVTGCEYKEVG